MLLRSVPRASPRRFPTFRRPNARQWAAKPFCHFDDCRCWLQLAAHMALSSFLAIWISRFIIWKWSMKRTA
eukprot:3591748-Pyramimonas_sp.AAC.1